MNATSAISQIHQDFNMEDPNYIELLEILEQNKDYFLKISRENRYLYSIWDVSEMARVGFGDTIGELIEEYRASKAAREKYLNEY